MHTVSQAHRCMRWKTACLSGSDSDIMRTPGALSNNSSAQCVPLKCIVLWLCVCAFVCLCVWTEGWGNRVIELFLDSDYPLRCCSFSDADHTKIRVTIGERNMCLCLHMCIYSCRCMHTLYVCICMYMCLPACTAPACVKEYFSHLCAEKSPRFPPCLSSSVFLSLWLVFLLPLCITAQAATLKCRERQRGLWLSQGLMLSFR